MITDLLQQTTSFLKAGSQCQAVRVDASYKEVSAGSPDQKCLGTGCYAPPIILL